MTPRSSNKEVPELLMAELRQLNTTQSKIALDVGVLKAKLYDDDGDIPEIKSQCQATNGHIREHAERLTRVETLQKERNRPSKKALTGYLSGTAALLVALWKAFMGGS